MIVEGSARGFFMPRQIQVSTIDGMKPSDALTYREFGVIFRGEYHEIVHLPSALSLCNLGACFQNETIACRAVEAIDRLRNEWSTMAVADWMDAGPKIAKICKKLGGRQPSAFGVAAKVDNTKNGYSGKEPA